MYDQWLENTSVYVLSLINDMVFIHVRSMAGEHLNLRLIF